MKSITIIILGDIPAKKNKWAPRSGGGMYLNQDTKDQIDDILWQIKPRRFGLKQPLDEELSIKMDIFTTNMRRDLDNMVTTLLDCLQKAEVIKNDNLVVKLEASKSKATQGKAIIEIKLAS